MQYWFQWGLLGMHAPGQPSQITNFSRLADHFPIVTDALALTDDAGELLVGPIIYRWRWPRTLGL